MAAVGCRRWIATVDQRRIRCPSCTLPRVDRVVHVVFRDILSASRSDCNSIGTRWSPLARAYGFAARVERPHCGGVWERSD
jgi:hypothetical protein